MTNYPTSLPSSTPVDHAEVSDEVRAIAAELGLDPSGSFASVVARLNALETENVLVTDNGDGTVTVTTAGSAFTLTDNGNGTATLTLSGQSVTVGSTGVVKVTQAQYNALTPPDPNTLYVIVG